MQTPPRERTPAEAPAEALYYEEAAFALVSTTPIRDDVDDQEPQQTPSASSGHLPKESALKSVLRSAKVRSLQAGEQARKARENYLRRSSEADSLQKRLEESERELEDLRCRHEECRMELVRAKNEAAAERHRRGKIVAEQKLSSKESKSASRSVQALTSERDRLQAKLSEASQRMAAMAMDHANKENAEAERIQSTSLQLESSRRLVEEKAREVEELNIRFQELERHLHEEHRLLQDTTAELETSKLSLIENGLTLTRMKQLVTSLATEATNAVSSKEASSLPAPYDCIEDFSVAVDAAKLSDMQEAIVQLLDRDYDRESQQRLEKCFAELTAESTDVVVRYRQKLTETLQQNCCLRDDLDRLEKELTASSNQLKVSQDDLDAVNKLRKVVEDERDEALCRIRSLEIDLRLTNDLVGRTLAALENMSVRESEAKHELELHEQMNRELVEQAEDLEKQVADCAQQLAEQHFSHSEVEAELTQALQEERARVSQVSKSRIELEVAQDNYQVDLEIARRTVAQKSKAVETATAELQRLREELEGKTSEYDLLVAALEREKNTLWERVSSLEDMELRNRDKIRELEAKNGHLLKAEAGSGQELQTLRARCEELKASEEEAKAVALDSQNQISVLSATMTGQLETLNRKIEDLGVGVSDRERELEEFQKRYENKVKECDEYVEEIEGLAQKLASVALMEEEADLNLSEEVAKRRRAEETLDQAKEYISQVCQREQHEVTRREMAEAKVRALEEVLEQRRVDSTDALLERVDEITQAAMSTSGYGLEDRLKGEADEDLPHTVEKVKGLADHCQSLEKKLSDTELASQRWKRACDVLRAEAQTMRRSREEADVLLLVKQKQIDSFRKIWYPRVMNRQRQKVEMLQNSLCTEMEKRKDAESKLGQLHQQLDEALMKVSHEETEAKLARAQIARLEAEIDAVHEELQLQEEASRSLHEDLRVMEDEYDRVLLSLNRHLRSTKANMLRSHHNMDRLEKVLESQDLHLVVKGAHDTPPGLKTVRPATLHVTPSGPLRFWQEQAKLRESPGKEGMQTQLDVTTASFALENSMSRTPKRVPGSRETVEEYHTPEAKSAAGSGDSEGLQASPLAVAFLTSPARPSIAMENEVASLPSTPQGATKRPPPELQKNLSFEDATDSLEVSVAAGDAMSPVGVPASPEEQAAAIYSHSPQLPSRSRRRAKALDELSSLSNQMPEGVPSKNQTPVSRRTRQSLRKNARMTSAESENSSRLRIGFGKENM
eukprot:scaffold338_cov377-Prasinococcus_capsulatus_cf.AAC.11